MKLSDMMPHADLPTEAVYMQAWDDENKPKYRRLDPCLHESTVITKITDAIGRDHYRLRCTFCGNMVKPLKKVEALKTLAGVVPADDRLLCDEIYDNPSNERRAQKAQFSAEYNRLYEVYKERRYYAIREYRRRYMDTARWKKLRAAVFDRDGHMCQVCGSTEFLECHHNTYDRSGAEDMDDLVTACRSCHFEHHEKIREKLIWLENNRTIKTLPTDPFA
jgi:5-methylcytosine-specific restriction endonuclease McrA